MSTASLALRQKHNDSCDRSAPDDEDEPRIYTADDIISLMRRCAYAASNAQMTSLEVQARVIVGELSAEAYNAGRLDGLLAMGGERETQF